LEENPETFAAAVFPGENLQSVLLPRLVAEIFKWVGGPIEMEALAGLLVILLEVREQPVESIEQSVESLSRQFAGSAISDDRRLEAQEILKKLWDEIKLLPLLGAKNAQSFKINFPLVSSPKNQLEVFYISRSSPRFE
jgi:hypothetical protein